MSETEYTSSTNIGIINELDIKIPVSGKVFTPFKEDDIIQDQQQLILQSVWDNGEGEMLTFYTSSTQSELQKQYYINVYQENPQINDNANPQFSISYGNFYGSGSTDLSNDASMTGISPSKVIYSQYANLLLPADQHKFKREDGTEMDSIVVFNIYRKYAKQRLEPGYWSINYWGYSSEYTGWIDDSSNVDTINNSFAGISTNIVSGSISDGVYSPNSPIYAGKVYHDHNVIIFDQKILDSIAGINITIQPNTNNKVNEKILTQLSQSVSQQSTGFKARNEQKITSNIYYVRLKNQDYNFSNNPTFVTGSEGAFRHPQMFRNPSTYITTIGLFNNNNEMLAVAKLSKPLLKNFDNESLIKIKLDF